MAFLLSISSSIGKKILLSALHHVDILDKDPSDFVDLAVGKKTTLEIRDVGLRVKRLISLLHLNLPSELHLSKARVSFLRVTLAWESVNPRIVIEIEGVQIRAKLSTDTQDVSDSGTDKHAGVRPRARSRHEQREATPMADSLGSSYSEDDEHLPTAEDLAKSFLREEPAEKIKELEEALNNQTEYLQESIMSSEDGEDENIVGMGPRLALPAVLRNYIIGAVDRMEIVAKRIDVQIDGHLPPETSSASSNDDYPSSVSVNFHIERVSVDGLTSGNPEINITTQDGRSQDAEPTSKNGKRRMFMENICARLISDPESFASLSRVSRSSSPVDIRSDLSNSHKSYSDSSMSGVSSRHREDSHRSVGEPEPEPEPEPVTEGHEDIPLSFPSQSTRIHEENEPLESSILTVDEDRFADAAYEEEEETRDQSSNHEGADMQHRSYHSTHPAEYGENSLFDDEGLLDYAVENGLLESRYDGAEELRPSSPDPPVDKTGEGATLRLEETIPRILNRPLSATVPDFQSTTQDATALELHQFSETSRSQPNPSTISSTSTDNLDAAKHATIEARRDSNSSSSSSPLIEDLAQSKLFTHDEAESMYMSAMSAAPSEASRHMAIPGGWDSVSVSSEGTAPHAPESLPPAMKASTVFESTIEAEDGCETPRPGSRASAKSTNIPSSLPSRTTPATIGNETFHIPLPGPPGSTYSDNTKISKPFLSIDKISVWFPFNLSDPDSIAQPNLSHTTEHLRESLQPTMDLGDESVFQDMPGSFSFYAESTATRRQKGSNTAEAFKRNLASKAIKNEVAPGARAPKQSPDLGIELEIGTIHGHIDLSAGRMMFQIVQRLLFMFNTPDEKAPVHDPKDLPSSSSESSLKLSIKHIAFAWIERLVTESLPDGPHARTLFRLDENPSDTILKTDIKNLQLTARTKANDVVARLQIGKFTFGFLDQDIISFDTGVGLRRSVRDTREIPDHDVQIDYQQASERRLRIFTRPLKLLFDVQMLEDALSSFGGFSGVLELGNSITSNNTVQSTPTEVQQRPRGVHFDRTPEPVPSSSPASLKVDLRCGEVSFLLRGKSCAVHVKTSAVKMILRESNVGIHISEVRVTGPYVDFPRGNPALVTELKDFNIRFLFTPEEVDLTRLLSIITPSKDKYENDSDILIDTLLRQRQKGSVLRVTVASASINVSDVDRMKLFQDLGNEMAKLSTVTKYLPEDDRPGILTLAEVKHFDGRVMVNERIGYVNLSCQASQFAHVGLPPLFAMEIGKILLNHGEETLIDEVIELRPLDQLPMIMARMIGDEMEPTIKAKLFNVCFEYRVSTIMAVLGLVDNGTTEDLISGIASSVATITGPSSPKVLSGQSSESGSSSAAPFKPLQVDLLLRDCALGLNPRKMPSKGLFVLINTRFSGALSKSQELSATLDIRKASVLIIDDIDRIDDPTDPSSTPTHTSALGSRQVTDLCRSGFISVSTISSAKISVNMTGSGNDQPQIVEVEFKDDLIILETCADSTQTLIGILDGLKPPMPPNTAEQYRTVVPLQEMMDSFSGDAFATVHDEAEDGTFTMDDADRMDDEVPRNLEYVGSFYNPESIPTEEDIGDGMLGEDDLHHLASPPITRRRGERGLLENFQEQYEVAEGEQEFDFDDNYFGTDSEIKGTAHKWDSTKNQYTLSNEFKVPDSPLKIRVRDTNVIWNLFDGFDWPKTRGVIAQAVQDVENRAEERRQKRTMSGDDDEENVVIEEDFLFNSVWISIPVNEEKGALSKKINHDVDDLVSETGSYATTTASRSTVRQRTPKSKRRKLKLERSRHHKITFELRGVAADIVVFPPESGETLSSVNLRVHDFEIFDHVPTSTWKKFATSLLDPTQREMGRSMINLELLTVKPVRDLAASELVLKVTVLPLRLHVDQDALDFITRFFEFKDDSVAPSTSKADQPFLQRVEVNTVQIKLDYKPKKVDYAGLRSGHTTEFMNFFILDGADIMLRHVILYGVTSFDKLHQTLNDVWMPDVKNNQLPGVLAGLAPIRSIVNVGSGVRDLVVVPMREYKKDGRIVRSVQKGALAFAKTTTSELARFGAKLAIGTQTVLEGAEAFLSPQSASAGLSSADSWEDLDPSSPPSVPDEPRAISHYANQPIGVMAGLRGAARHLERDLLTARDAVIAIPGEVMESGSAGGAAKAVIRRAPTVILKPALGATKAVSNALFGVSNALDSQSRRKMEDKYKSY